MKIFQNSDVPIYRQIAMQLENDILNGKIGEGEYLPSIRSLAKDLKISVITTMKAYELLEEEGLCTGVQGKGYIVSQNDSEMRKEQLLRRVENSLNAAIDLSKVIGMSDKELLDTLKILQRSRDL